MKQIERIGDDVLTARLEQCMTDAETIIELYRQGYNHRDIVARGYDIQQVRSVISEATAKDAGLYPRHLGMPV